MAEERALASRFVRQQIERLCGTENEAAVRATLARLRRGIGKAPGSVPESWAVTLNGLPAALTDRGDSPTRGEWAVHTALSLYALHQQGKDLKKQCMSRPGEYLGIAVRRLVQSDEDEQRIKRRFDAAATSQSLQELSHHLRGLVQLLKSKDIPLDYPELTSNLFWFQFPTEMDSVRLRWGRDFYRVREKEGSDEPNKLGKDDWSNGNQ